MQSNIGSEGALEHWIPLWCPADPCMALRLNQNVARVKQEQGAP